METWAIFSQNDVVLALIGLAGFTSVVITLSTATSRVNSIEIDRKYNNR
jgi:hypothetical protein